MTNTSLPKVEIVLYFIIWIGAFTYSIYNVYLAGKYFDTSNSNDHFKNGWFGYKKDVTNKIWTDRTTFDFSIMYKWIAAHLVLTQTIRWFSPKFIPLVHCLTTVSMISIHFGPVFAVMMFLYSSSYFLLLQLNSVKKTWQLGLPFAITFSSCLYEYWTHTSEEFFNIYLLMVCSMWQHMKCTSFVIDHVNAEDKSSNTSLKCFYDFIGYCFYLPVYFNGPCLIYSNFGPYMYQPFKRLTWDRIGSFVLQILRFLFWFAVIEASLHILYFHALEKQLQHVAHLGYWTLAGIEFLCCAFFFMRHFVFYGLAITLARFDGYNPPQEPKCVFHYHLYTDLYRVFDVGYYQFIQKYVYQPLGGRVKDWRGRLLASTVCFTFGFFWHGISPMVLVWSFLNYTAVTLVALATMFFESELFKNWETRTLSQRNSRRLAALLAVPTLLIGTIGSTFFFSGLETAIIFSREMFIKCSWTEFAIELFFLYCYCQVSVEIKNWQRERMLKEKPRKLE